jgi:hypothetical protein
VTTAVTGLAPPVAYNPAMFQRTTLLSVAGLLAAGALAGCGGSSPPAGSGSSANNSGSSGASSSSGGPSFKQASTDAYKNAACMRSHGVPNFPDPQVSQSGNEGSIIVHLAGINKTSPAFKSAQSACAHLMPSGPIANGPSAQEEASHRTAGVAFARCLRTHGFPNFPDPSSSGELNTTMVTAAGINIHQPAFTSAALGCTSVTHGVLTRAMVARAIANAGTQSTAQAPSGTGTGSGSG